MDTLSRKHRLRQQEMRQQEACQRTGKENRNEKLKRFASNFARSETTASNNFLPPDQDQEEFTVYRVVDFHHSDAGREPVKSNGSAISNNKRIINIGANITNETDVIIIDEDFADDEVARLNDDDEAARNSEDFSIVCGSPDRSTNPPNNGQGIEQFGRRLQVYGNHVSSHLDCYISRSTGASSGFHSADESSASRSAGRQQSTKYQGHLQQKQSLNPNDSKPDSTRSHLFEDLDRLIHPNNNNNNNIRSCSPTESYLSYADSQPASKEFDCSTLCRDEFSSFIATVESEQQQQQQLQQQHRGPILVGVRDSFNLKISDGFDRPAKYKRPFIDSLPAWSSGEQSPDKELVVIEDNRLAKNDQWCSRSSSSCASSSSSSLRSTPAEHDEQDLGKLLDVYLARLESLIRLNNGDKTVSLTEAFGQPESAGNQYAIIGQQGDKYLEEAEGVIQVSQEHRTLFHYKPIGPSARSIKVIQEISLETDDDDERNLIHLLNTTSDDFRSIASMPQTSAELDWPLDRPPSSGPAEITLNGQQRSKIEESFCNRLQVSNIGNQKQLVSTIKRHLNEFLDDYLDYQRELRQRTSFATDWRQNWLFSYKRLSDDQSTTAADDEAGQQVGPAKRAKLSPDLQTELISYSTLLLQRRPVKVNYPIGKPDDCQHFEIDRFYEACQNPIEEMSLARTGCNGNDVCTMLLLDDCDEKNPKPSDGQSNHQRRLVIGYESSGGLNGLDGRHRFSAYGHLFSLPVSLSCTSRQLERIKRKLLRRLGEATWNPKNSICLPDERQQQRVRFSFEVGNVQLLNKLPVIQFCAKISGALPISVRWFKTNSHGADEELSSLRDPLRGNPRNKLRFREVKEQGDDWPIEMHGHYDYEYRTDWASWFRFRRRSDEIMFEIREPSLDKDYSDGYKCIIQNYCSSQVCCFSLREREVPKRVKPERKQVSGRAVLRTWSQRTLHKPVATERRPADTDARVPSEGGVERMADWQGAGKSWLQSVGRLSAVVAEEDKLGEDFPYHPANLLKRLEENKFSIVKRPAACGQQVNLETENDQVSPTTTATTTAHRDLIFTDSIKLPAPHDKRPLDNRQDRTSQPGSSKESIRKDTTRLAAAGAILQTLSNRISPIPKQRRALTPKSLKDQTFERDTDCSSVETTTGLSNSPANKPAGQNQVNTIGCLQVSSMAGNKSDTCSALSDGQENIISFAKQAEEEDGNKWPKKPPKANVKSLISRFSAVG